MVNFRVVWHKIEELNPDSTKVDGLDEKSEQIQATSENIRGRKAEDAI
jgi:hypothetical protein